jgi:hypothetical protein
MSFPCVTPIWDADPFGYLPLVRSPKGVTGTGGVFDVLYTTALTAYDAIPLVTNGIPTTIQDNATKLFFRVSIVLALPLVIIMTVLILVLVRSSVMMYDIGVMMLLLTYVIAAIAVAFVLSYTEDVVDNLLSEIQDMLAANWKANGPEIQLRLTVAWSDPARVQCPAPNELAIAAANLASITCKGCK